LIKTNIKFLIIKITRLIVTFSIERLLAVYWPLKHKTQCNTEKIKKYVKGILLIGLGYNLINLIIFGLDKQSADSKKCTIIGKYLYLAEYFIPIDLMMNTLIPVVTISILNTLIALKLSYFPSTMKQNELKCINQDTKTNEVRLKESVTVFSKYNTIQSNGFQLKILPSNEQRFLNVNNSFSSFKNKKNSIKNMENFSFRSEQSLSDTKSIFSAISLINLQTRKKKYSKTSKVLFLISITFLVLHLPMCISKIYFILNMTNVVNSISSTAQQINSTVLISVKTNFTNGTQPLNNAYEFEFSLSQKILFNLSNKLYYLNFGLNFFLYSFNRSK